MSARDPITTAIWAAASTRLGLARRLEPEPALHVAVMVEPYLRYVLDGTKAIESRISKTRQPPYHAAECGDLVLFKESSGPVVGCAVISNAMYFELDHTPLLTLRERFGPLIRALPDFWEAKADARYASLLRIVKVETFEPFPVPKRDPRGWVRLAPQGGRALLSSVS